jgi:DNA-directed RNA polymerase sigma subunit (sigma70/sigma32)
MNADHTLSLTRERIRQIEASALKLKQPSRSSRTQELPQ